MKIVAIMQNQWAKNPKSLQEVLARNPTRRNEIIKRLLFRGCVSGKRLSFPLGPWLNQIVWEEASPIISDKASFRPVADVAHIQAFLQKENPDLVIAFGKVAADATRDLWRGYLYECPHPASRDRSAFEEKIWWIRRQLDTLKGARVA